MSGEHIKKEITYILVIFILFFGATAHAATLRLNPNTGVYTVGKPFTVSVVLNTEGKSVNAADGSLSFNPRELQVSSVSRASSIFNLWTEEPKYSNTGGTISFGGGSPTGYKGAGGSILSVTFRPLGAGTPKVNFVSGSVLAADGLGTNVLTGMNGGAYTIAAESESPAPEYIPPPNTPPAPNVVSASHPDQTKWYRDTTAKLAWEVPEGVTQVRTLLDEQTGTIPTKVYEEPFTEKTIDNLDEGVSYFHIQFRNVDGWGKSTHFRLAVDRTSPKDFAISEISNPEHPEKTLQFTFEDLSPVVEYRIQIDGGEPSTYVDTEESRTYTLPVLAPGYHTVAVEAFDSAGNSSVAHHSFTVESFEKPIFTDYPIRINPDVIPAIKGKTRPQSTVHIEIRDVQAGSIVYTAEGASQNVYTTKSNEAGEFIFVPDHAFDRGVYAITATAQDLYGRQSEKSDEVRIIVEEPGYIVIGSFLVSALSVLIPLIALCAILLFGTWYLYHRLNRWRKKVMRETREAETKITEEFASVILNLNQNISILKQSRKGKLTKAESDLIEEIERGLKHAQDHIKKEVEDIERLVK